MLVWYRTLVLHREYQCLFVLIFEIEHSRGLYSECPPCKSILDVEHSSMFVQLIERFRVRADTVKIGIMITVSVYVSRVLDFVSQNIGMCHLSALAFIMSVFFRQTWPIETLCFRHCIFSLFCLQMIKQINSLYIKHDTSESNSMGKIVDLGQKDSQKTAKQYPFFNDVYELLYLYANVCAKYDSRG